MLDIVHFGDGSKTFVFIESNLKRINQTVALVFNSIGHVSFNKVKNLIASDENAAIFNETRIICRILFYILYYVSRSI